MAKRNRETTPKVIRDRLAKGRGGGHGANYEPWLRIQDVPSQGLSWRIYGWKTGREHHLLSSLEAKYFYTLEWSECVVDVREQYGLPLDKTIEIAAECGYRHPTDPMTQEPVVMTTDFVIDVERGASREVQARTVKYTQSFNRPQKDYRKVEPLTSQRTLEKLEIERRYWKERNISWGIVTEREIPEALARNVEWLHPYRDLDLRLEYPPALINRVTKLLTPEVRSGIEGLSTLTSRCDEQLGLDAGTSLLVVRYLLATRKWLTDMNQMIVPSKRLALLGETVSFTPNAADKYGIADQRAV